MAFRAADPARERHAKAKGLARPDRLDAPCPGSISGPSLLTHPPLKRADGYSPVTRTGYAQLPGATRHPLRFSAENSPATLCRKCRSQSREQKTARSLKAQLDQASGSGVNFSLAKNRRGELPQAVDESLGLVPHDVAYQGGAPTRYSDKPVGEGPRRKRLISMGFGS